MSINKISLLTKSRVEVSSTPFEDPLQIICLKNVSGMNNEQNLTKEKHMILINEAWTLPFQINVENIFHASIAWFLENRCETSMISETQRLYH
jgi:hypothetical protein